MHLIRHRNNIESDNLYSSPNTSIGVLHKVWFMQMAIISSNLIYRGESPPNYLLHTIDNQNLDYGYMPNFPSCYEVNFINDTLLSLYSLYGVGRLCMVQSYSIILETLSNVKLGHRGYHKPSRPMLLTDLAVVEHIESTAQNLSSFDLNNLRNSVAAQETFNTAKTQIRFICRKKDNDTVEVLYAKGEPLMAVVIPHRFDNTKLIKTLFRQDFDMALLEYEVISKVFIAPIKILTPAVLNLR